MGGVCPSEWVGWRRALTSWAYPGQTEPRLRRPAALQAEASRVLAAPSAHDSTGEGTSDVSQPLYHSLNFPDTSSELPGEKPCQACPETILCPSLTPSPPTTNLLVKVKLILNRRKADVSNKSAVPFPIQMVKTLKTEECWALAG